MCYMLINTINRIIVTSDGTSINTESKHQSIGQLVDWKLKIYTLTDFAP